MAKLLANRLCMVLSKMIDLRQSAFLGGRKLLHSALVANEVVDKRRKRNCILFKVDFEKVKTRWHGISLFICYKDWDSMIYG